MSGSSEIEDHIVASIRRIIRAVDVQSRHLLDHHQLTGPQLATLREVEKAGESTTSALARAVHLSQPTVSGILTRLERQGFVERERSAGDRRNVVIRITQAGKRAVAEAPSLLQERFRAKLEEMEDWEQHWLLAALERIASMMDAQGIDAAPYLETGLVAQPPDEPGDDESEAISPEG